jgi:hypothetical protein
MGIGWSASCQPPPESGRNGTTGNLCVGCSGLRREPAAIAADCEWALICPRDQNQSRNFRSVPVSVNLLAFFPSVAPCKFASSVLVSVGCLPATLSELGCIGLPGWLLLWLIPPSRHVEARRLLRLAITEKGMCMPCVLLRAIRCRCSHVHIEHRPSRGHTSCVASRTGAFGDRPSK